MGSNNLFLLAAKCGETKSGGGAIGDEKEEGGEEGGVEVAVEGAVVVLGVVMAVEVQVIVLLMAAVLLGGKMTGIRTYGMLRKESSSLVSSFALSSVSSSVFLGFSGCDALSLSPSSPEPSSVDTSCSLMGDFCSLTW